MSYNFVIWPYILVSTLLSTFFLWTSLQFIFSRRHTHFVLVRPYVWMPWKSCGSNIHVLQARWGWWFGGILRYNSAGRFLPQSVIHRPRSASGTLGWRVSRVGLYSIVVILKCGGKYNRNFLQDSILMF